MHFLTWMDFRRGLEKQFGDGSVQNDHWIRIADSRIQRPDEIVGEFVIVMEDLWRKLGIRDGQMRYSFINKLWPEIGEVLSKKNGLKTYEDAKLAALSYEDHMGRRQIEGNPMLGAFERTGIQRAVDSEE